MKEWMMTVEDNDKKKKTARCLLLFKFNIVLSSHFWFSSLISTYKPQNAQKPVVFEYFSCFTQPEY